MNSELGALHSTGAEFLESTIVLVPIEKIQELMGTSGLLSYSFYLKSFSAVPAARHIIDQYLKDNIPDLESFEYSDARINPFFEGSMGFLSVMGGFFLILICSAVSLTIINSLTMGIIERTREIGTLRAIGFNRNAIQKIFVAENLLITLCALLVGTGLSSIISHFINDAQIMFNPPGTANKIPFMLLWNLNVAFVASALLLAVTYASAWIVISRKMKSKLISLLNDTE